jgi:GNAT superfamily N-acetyltransferase
MGSCHDDDYRETGYGKLLLSEAENKAKELGYKIIHLDTFEFQAPNFYKRMGYVLCGTIENCPEGYNWYHFYKRI